MKTIMIIESIKEGFRLVNNNLPLVFVRIVVTIINIAAFFIFLGVPVIAAIVFMGLDLAQAKEHISLLAANPSEVISRYLGIVFLVGTSFILYLLFASILLLYALGGTIGSLKNSAVNVHYKFSLSSFLREARENFPRLFRLISLVLLILIIILTVFAFSGGVIVAVQQIFAGRGSAVEVFFSSFIMLSIMIIGAIVFFAYHVFGVYSIIASVTKGAGAVDAVKLSLNFLKQKPGAFLLYIILIIGLVIVNLFFIGIQSSLSMVPGVGVLLDIFGYLINAFFQSYLIIVMWGAVLAYYLKGAQSGGFPQSYEI